MHWKMERQKIVAFGMYIFIPDGRSMGIIVYYPHEKCSFIRLSSKIPEVAQSSVSSSSVVVNLRGDNLITLKNRSRTDFYAS